MRSKILGFGAAVFAFALVATAAKSQTEKAALVIASGAYRSGDVSGCGGLGRDVAAALTTSGFEVEQVVDGSSIAMRSAIMKFAGQLAGERKIAVVYVCSQAVVAQDRLFLLPVDVDQALPYRLETQGVLLKAMVHALDGTDGVLLADLDAADPEAARKSLRALAPASGVQMALSVDADRFGVVGRDLLAEFARSGFDWISISRILENARSKNGATTIAVVSHEQMPNPQHADADIVPQAGTVPVPQARPVDKPVIRPASKAKAAGVFRQKKAKVPRARKKEKPNSGFFRFLAKDKPKDRQGTQ